jgi:hypothetical protein
MSEQIQKLPTVVDWQAASLRLTAFPGMGAKVPIDTWFEKLTGQAPDQITRQRSGEMDAIGTIDATRLALNIAPVRIEWRLIPAEEDAILTNNFPNIGNFSQSADIFLQLMSGWLHSIDQEVNRLAFGAELLIPVEDLPSGYRLLSSFLPSVTLDPDRSTDFLYQINRPRESQDVALSRNRLTKWSVSRLARLAFLPSGQVIPVVEGDSYFARLELDINTSQNLTEMLPKDSLPAIFQELIELGKEISLKGEVP